MIKLDNNYCFWPKRPIFAIFDWFWAQTHKFTNLAALGHFRDVHISIFIHLRCKNIFRQHAASIYGFVRFVSLSKKDLKCNISLTEAQIFMKFVTYVYEKVLDHQPNFHKDRCKDARARGINTATCDETSFRL